MKVRKRKLNNLGEIKVRKLIEKTDEMEDRLYNKIDDVLNNELIEKGNQYMSSEEILLIRAALIDDLTDYIVAYRFERKGA